MKISKLTIFPIAATILLSGCGTVIAQNEQIGSSAIIEQPAIEQPAIEPVESVQELIVPDVIDENSQFFQRGYDTKASYEDLILTIEEKGVEVSEDAQEVIRTISDNKIDVDTEFVDLLSVDERAFLQVDVTSKKPYYQNNEFYDAKSDTILWDKLAEKIYANSVKAQEIDLATKSNNRSMYNGFINFEYQDVQIVIEQLQRFTNEVKSKYPTYDLSHLAKVLSDLSMLYQGREHSEKDVAYAYSTPGKLVWFLDENGNYPDLSKLESVNTHEFKHLLCSGVKDEHMTMDYYVSETGVTKNENSDMNFDFISEAEAETYSTKVSNRPILSYYNQNTVLNSIKFVLSLQDDFDLDAFEKYSFLQNPIAMMQQFSITDETKDTYKDNLFMLSSFDKVLTKVPYDYIEKIDKKYGNDFLYGDDGQYEVVFNNLSNYAMGELTRLFFTNLVMTNDKDNNMSVDYNLYLIRLYELNVNLDYTSISNVQSYDIDSKSFNDNYRNQLDEFMKYYSKVSGISYDELMDSYNNFDIFNQIEFPENMNYEKTNFYNDIVDTYYNYVESYNSMFDNWDIYIANNYKTSQARL